MILFVVPAYNEEDNIQKLIEGTRAEAEVNRWEYRLIVVDDGSEDRTAEKVTSMSEAYPCELIRYTPNGGVGKAFREGLNRALELAAAGDVIVTKEADGTSDLKILPAMIRVLDEGADAALASCYAKDGGIEGTNALRLILSRTANYVINFLFHIKGIHTYSSFYRAYRPDALCRVRDTYGDYYEEPGFACVIELIIRMSKLGLTLKEVPMVLDASKRIGKSKMKFFKTIQGYARVILRNAILKPR